MSIEYLTWITLALTVIVGAFAWWRTQPDPTWTATIAGPSLAQAAGLGMATAAQVQAEMN